MIWAVCSLFTGLCLDHNHPFPGWLTLSTRDLLEFYSTFHHKTLNESEGSKIVYRWRGFCKSRAPTLRSSCTLSAHLYHEPQYTQKGNANSFSVLLAISEIFKTILTIHMRTRYHSPPETNRVFTYQKFAKWKRFYSWILLCNSPLQSPSLLSGTLCLLQLDFIYLNTIQLRFFRSTNSGSNPSRSYNLCLKS